MERSGNSLPPERALSETSEQHYPTSLELKELSSMFAEKRTDTEAVLDVIEAALLEPIPDLSDADAVAEYNTKMEMLKQMARDYLARTELLREMWTAIEQRANQTRIDI